MIQKEVMQENLAQKDITRKGGILESEICGAIFDLDGVLLDSMAVWNTLEFGICKNVVFNRKQV